MQDFKSTRSKMLSLLSSEEKITKEQILQELDNDVNLQDEKGLTLLHWAIKLKNTELLKTSEIPSFYRHILCKIDEISQLQVINIF